MTLQYYIGGKITGLSGDTKPLGVPEFTTFIETDTFTEYILVAGVWQQIGGTPVGDVFPSMYESFNPLTVVNNQHLVEWFSGAVLGSEWSTVNVQGGGSFAMVDGINGGYNVSTGAATSDRSGIAFTGVRHYNPLNAIMYVTARRVSANGLFRSGFRNVLNTVTTQLAQVQNNASGTFQALLTADAGQTSTDTDVAVDTTMHIYKIELNPTDAILDIDGVEKAVNTTTLPTLAQQPNPIWCQEIATGVCTANVRYVEVFNS